jgi:hypothetical protein
MSGWCVANIFDLTPRERLFSMIAATAADVDGLGRIVSEEAYWRFHHILGHSLAFAMVISMLLAAFSTHRAKSFVIYLALAHLHLLMDFFGSGPGWGIAYFWPLSAHPYAWEFFSWQNITTAGVLLAWTMVIAARKGRTPLELITPDLDQRFVRWLRGIRSTRELR